MKVEVEESYIAIIPESEEEKAMLKQFKAPSPLEAFNDIDGIHIHNLCPEGLTPDETRYYRNYFKED